MTLVTKQNTLVLCIFLHLLLQLAVGVKHQELDGSEVDDSEVLVHPVHVHGKSIVVLATVQSVTSTSIELITALMKLCTWFDHGKCNVIVGSEHTDRKTVECLKKKFPDDLQFQDDPPKPQGPFKVLGKSEMNEPRTWRYARIRNALMESALAKQTDYIMPVDTDGTVMLSDITYGAITTAMSERYEDEWDATAFVSVRPYYDWWAARCTVESPNCWTSSTCFIRQNFECVSEAERDSTVTFHKVASAYNGLSIYKSSTIGTCRYDGHGGFSGNGFVSGQDCEHVALNKCLTRKGTRFMLSSLRIDAPHPFLFFLGGRPKLP